MPQTLKRAFHLWLTLTCLILISLLTLYLRNGQDGLNLFIQQWPLSNLAVTLAASSLTWGLFGAILYLLANKKINQENAWQTAGFFLVMFIYLNIFRERFRYGDYHYYLEAAIALVNGQTLPDTYLYLPLWQHFYNFSSPSAIQES